MEKYHPNTKRRARESTLARGSCKDGRSYATVTRMYQAKAGSLFFFFGKEAKAGCPSFK